MACTRFVAIIKINRPGTTTRITKLNCSLFIRSYKYSQFSRFGDHTHCTDIGGRSIVLPFIKRQRDTHIHVHVGWNHHSCGRRNQAAKKGWKSIFIKIDMLKSIVRHHPRHLGHCSQQAVCSFVIHTSLKKIDIQSIPWYVAGKPLQWLEQPWVVHLLSKKDEYYLDKCLPSSRIVTELLLNYWPTKETFHLRRHQGYPRTRCELVAAVALCEALLRI